MSSASIPYARLLTPAAESVLSEMNDAWREELLSTAARIASSRRGDIGEISSADVIRAFEELRGGWRSLEASGTLGRSRYVDRLLVGYALIGISIALGAFAFVVVRSAAEALSSIEFAAALAGVTGGGLATFSLILLTIRRRRLFSARIEYSARSSEASQRTLALLERWQSLEALLRKNASFRLGDSVADEPLSTLIRKLADSNVLRIEDQDAIRKLLRLRNAIVHEGRIPSEDEYIFASRLADSLIERLIRESDQ